MSNLAGLNLDPNVKESTGEFVVLPAGKYKAVITADELKDNKSETGKILVLNLQIIEGQYSQTVIVDHVNITNTSEKAQAIGQGILKRICNICNVAYPPQDTSGLYGKPMIIDLKVEEFTSNTTGKTLQSNKVRSYAPVTKDAVQQQQSQQQQTSAPAAW